MMRGVVGKNGKESQGSGVWPSREVGGRRICRTNYRGLPKDEVYEDSLEWEMYSHEGCRRWGSHLSLWRWTRGSDRG